ncbi:MAG: thioredoxin family protein [Eubacteriales bacterium]
MGNPKNIDNSKTDKQKEINKKIQLRIEQENIRKKKLYKQVGITALIIVLILGIFIYKALSTNNDITPKGNSTDIPLSVSSIDLAALKAYKMPIIIDFGADSCIPCKEMAPVLKKLNAEMQKKAVIQFVDVWKYQQAVGSFPVTVIPTQFFYNADGTPYVPSDDIQKNIKFEMHKDLKTGQHNFTSHQGGLTEIQMRQILAEMGVQ